MSLSQTLECLRSYPDNKNLETFLRCTAFASSILCLLPADALAIAGDLAAQFKSLEETTTSAHSLGLMGICGATMCFSIWKGNVLGMLISAVGAVGSVKLGDFVANNFPMVI